MSFTPYMLIWSREARDSGVYPRDSSGPETPVGWRLWGKYRRLWPGQFRNPYLGHGVGKNGSFFPIHPRAPTLPPAAPLPEIDAWSLSKPRDPPCHRPISSLKVWDQSHRSICAMDSGKLAFHLLHLVLSRSMRCACFP
jgi:hypothetical protein